MSNSPKKELGIALVPILVGFIVGAPAGSLVRASEAATKYAISAQTKPLERRVVDNLKIALAGFKQSEHISDTELDNACEISLHALDDWGQLTGRQIVKYGTAENIAQLIIDSSPQLHLSPTEISLCKKVLTQLLQSIINDPDFRKRTQFDVVIEIARQIDDIHTIPISENNRPLTSDERKRGRSYSRQTIGRIESALDTRKHHVTISATKECINMISNSRWQQRVDEKLKNIFDFQANQGKPSHEVFRLINRDPIDNDNLRLSLSHAVTQRISAHDSTLDSGTYQAFKDAQSSRQWLKSQSSKPKYRTCLPILGAWGSGKSTFANAVARQIFDSDDKVVVIVLKFVNSLGLDSTLLNEAASCFGRNFSSVFELSEVLTASNQWAVIVVDNADKWATVDPSFISQLQNRIAEGTEHDSLRWIVTATTANYDVMACADYPKFWDRYGWYPRTSSNLKDTNLGGWLNLDQINIDETIGHYILIEKLPARVAASAEAFRVKRDSRSNAWNLLCRPLAAWTYVEAEDDREDFTKFNDSVFAERYWQSARLNIAPTEGLKLLFERILEDTSISFASDFDQGRNLNELRKEILGNNSLTPAVDEFYNLIDRLCGAGIFNLSGDELQVGAESLWAQRLSETLAGDTWPQPDITLRDLRNIRIDGNISSERLRDSVIQARLAKLANDPNLKWLADDVVVKLLDKTGRNSAIWGCALQIPIDSQAKLVRALNSDIPIGAVLHDTYLFLRWCLHSPLSIWGDGEQLKAIQPRYETVAEGGLGTYLSIVLKRILKHADLSTESHQLDVLPLIQGSDASGVGGEVASFFIKYSRKQSDSIDLLRSVAKYLRRLSSAALDKGLVGHDDSMFMPVLIEGAVAAALENGVELGYAQLIDSTWMNSNTGHEKLSIAMRSAAHNEIGHCFNEGEQSSFQVSALTLRLANGNVDQMTSAIFIIRHTVSTYGRADLLVSEFLHPSLMRLRDRKKEIPMNILKRWLYPLLQANGIPIERDFQVGAFHDH